MAAKSVNEELCLLDENLIRILKHCSKKRKSTVDDYVEEGTALLKARQILASDEKFGKVIRQIGFTDTQQSRNNSMHMAEFFEGKDTSKISVHCAREISKPKYRDVAEKAYSEAIGKDFSTAGITNFLEGLLKDFRVEHGLEYEKKPSYPTIAEKYPTKFKFDKNRLNNASLEELSIIYKQSDLQGPLVKGLILLELRKRFPSNVDFNKAVKKYGLNVDKQQKRTLFMSLASFFEKRSMEGICLTVAYKISSPQNADIAESLYDEALGKNLSVRQIKDLIHQKKAILVGSDDGTVVEASTIKQKVEINKSLVDTFVSLAKEDYPSREGLISFFQSCLKSVKKLPKKETDVKLSKKETDVIEGEAVKIPSTDLSVDSLD